MERHGVLVTRLIRHGEVHLSKEVLVCPGINTDGSRMLLDNPHEQTDQLVGHR